MKFLFLFFIILSCNDIKRPKLESIFLSTFLYTGVGSEKVGIISSDFSSTGKFNLLNPNSNFSISTFTNIHSDAVGKFIDGKVFILNRLNRDSILVLNPENAFLPLVEFSVGKGNNPYDIVLIDSSKAYISLYNARYILVVNPSTGIEITKIDLSQFAETTSNGTTGIDGIPEIAYMFIEENSVYVQAQRLDKNDPSGIPSPNSDSILIEIDSRNEKIINSYTMKSRNPISKIQKINIGDTPHLIFAAPNRLGFISKLDGGIIAFNLKTKKFRDSFLLSETEVGGDILGQVCKNETEGYAYVLDSSFNKAIFEFNPITGKKVKTILNFPATAGNISGLSLSKSGKLYIGDGSFTRPGITIIDTNKLDRPKINPVPIEINLRPTDIFTIE